MRAEALGFTDKTSTLPPRGERVAVYIESYLAAHRGLSVGELAFRLRADKRDLGRLLRDRSCGWRLEDSLAAYFGSDFVDAVFAPVLGDGPSIRQRELDRERAELNARNEALQRARRARSGVVSGGPELRLAADQDRATDLQPRR